MDDQRFLDLKVSLSAEERAAVQARYDVASHRVQTAVGFAQGLGDTGSSAKHLRTGLDMRAADMHGLVSLLIAKRVFTLDEYLQAMAISAEQEADRYEQVVQKLLGDTQGRVKTL